jgi:hypothetical protein
MNQSLFYSAHAYVSTRENFESRLFDYYRN